MTWLVCNGSKRATPFWTLVHAAGGAADKLQPKLGSSCIPPRLSPDYRTGPRTTSLASLPVPGASPFLLPLSAANMSGDFAETNLRSAGEGLGKRNENDENEAIAMLSYYGGHLGGDDHRGDSRADGSSKTASWADGNVSQLLKLTPDNVYACLRCRLQQRHSKFQHQLQQTRPKVMQAFHSHHHRSNQHQRPSRASQRQRQISPSPSKSPRFMDTWKKLKSSPKT